MNSIRRTGRFSYRNNKRYNFSRTNNNYSNNKQRSKGNVPVLYDKYIKLAKEAASSGDRIQAEYYHQFADHYARIINENDLKFLDNEEFDKSLSEKESEKESEKVSEKESEKVSEKVSAKVSAKVSEKVSNDSNSNNTVENDKSQNETGKKFVKPNDNEEEYDNNSLETVSFISQPINKTTKPKK